MRDVSRPLTAVDNNGQSCVHNFCTDCLRAYVAAPRAANAKADCPICRRTIVGVQRNQLATSMIDLFLRLHERHTDEQQRAAAALADLGQQLADARELESSASQVNNLLRCKLEQQKAKLTDLADQLRAATARVDELDAERRAALARVDELEAERRATRVDAVASRLQEMAAPSPPVDAAPLPPPLPLPVTMSQPALLDPMGGSALLTQAVTRLWSWATSASPSATAFARDLKTRYEVFERRGSKKNSGVFRGADRESGERVALKNIREPADVREVMLLTKMRHRSLVRCEAVAFGSGSVACAVLAPYVESDLAFAVTAGLVRPAAAPIVVRQLLEALAYMHSGDVVHGNVAPTSILVTSEHAVLLAGCTYAHSVRAPRMPGVPQRAAPWSWHTAPELLAVECGAAVTAPLGAQLKACDVWSVGAVALFVLLQRAPFQGATAAELLQAVGRLPLAELAADEAASGFCAALLQLDAANRPLASAALKHAFVGGSDDEANVCALAYELQDSCLAAFVKEFVPKLKFLHFAG